VGILVQGPESEIIENNKAACDLLGLTEDQLLGKHLLTKIGW
jgi:PAS domain S-box-containing protein